MNKKSLIILISVIALLIVECIAFVCIKFSNDSGSDFHVHRYVYSITKTQTCNWDGEKKGECACGDTIITILPKLEHSLIDGTCELCKKNVYELCEHSWNEATCEVAKHCSNCGLSEGEELKHYFINNVCEKCDLKATNSAYFTFTLLDDGTYSVKLKNNAQEKIVIPNSYNGNPVTVVDFKGGFSNLTSVIVPNSITKINTSAFSSCYNLSSVILPNGLEEIANGAFASCSSLTSIKIPKTVTSIGWCAFDSCINLTSIVIPDSVTYMGTGVFQNCTNLLSAKISDQLTEIPDSTFYRCTSLASIEIPDNVTTINRDAFQGCKNLRSIVIGKNLKFVNYYAFGGCKNLSDIYIKDLTAWLNLQAVDYSNDKSTNCVIFNADVTRRLYLNNELITKLVIPDGITYINARSFQNCVSITEVVIPDSVDVISDRAFCNCTALKKLTISDNVSFGSYVFTGCLIEELVTDAENLEWIDKTNLKSVIITDGNIPNTVFLGCTKLTSVVIKSGVKSIGERAFAVCTKLSSVVIEKGLLKIGDKAFFNCPSLKDVKYTGSQADWDAIKKSSAWNEGFASNTVIYNYEYANN